MTMAIIFEQVTKVIGHNIVLDHVNCEMDTGKITGLQGINGSGKTMMMRLIAGLIYPTKGQVRVDGAIVGKDVSFPPSLGVMLENPAFLNTYSGYDNLKLLAAINGVAGVKDIDRALERVGLLDAKNKKYRKYSLGMKQRLGIAAAIMERPDLILVDEPTNALDDKGIEQICALLRRERDRGALLVLSCHDASILEEMSDEIFHICDGKVERRAIS